MRKIEKRFKIFIKHMSNIVFEILSFSNIYFFVENYH